MYLLIYIYQKYKHCYKKCVSSRKPYMGQFLQSTFIIMLLFHNYKILLKSKMSFHLRNFVLKI